MTESEKKKILIVEDESFNINILCELLNPLYKLIVAKEGKKAFEILQNDPLPDLILLDVLLPDSSGFEICKTLKTNQELKQIPVIFMTACKSSENISMGFSSGGVDYVTKPIDYIVLLKRIKFHLENRQLMLDVLQKLEDINTLRGFLPICSFCKNIRKDSGNWQKIESYIETQIDLTFVRSLCPECSKMKDSGKDIFEVNPFQNKMITLDDLTYDLIDSQPSKNTVLIVDDERFNIKMLIEQLGPDYELLVAKDGETALKLAGAKKKPDLILLDILMVGMNGFEVCQKLKKNDETSEIPVIFMTVKGKTEDIFAGYDCGGSDYIIKPIDYKELCSRVSTHIQFTKLLLELKTKISEIQTLTGLLPICPGCKKVRDDSGYWDHLDCYVSNHSKATFSHGICPDCMKKHYPDFVSL